MATLTLGQNLALNAASAVFGGLVTLAVQYYLHQRQRASLRVNYRDSLTGHKEFTTATRVIEDTQGISVQQTYQAMYVNLSVINRRRETAKNCRGYLVGVETVENGRFNAVNPCNSLPLAWAYRSQDDARKGIDIPYGVTQFLNIFSCAQPDVSTGFFPCTVPQLFHLPAWDRFSQPGEFRFRLQITADNANTQLFGLRVRWAGPWDTAWADNCRLLSIVQDNSVLDNMAWMEAR
jgi:hypothetical protein